MLLVAQLVEQVIILIELESALPCLKKSASYPEPVQSNRSVTAYFSEFNFNIIRSCLSSGLPLRFSD
jgi:hypothetical protein